MRRLTIALLIAAIAGAAFVAASAQAQDTPTLWKREARPHAVVSTKSIGRWWYLETDWATDWSFWVEKPRYARRNNRTKITFDAQFTLYDDVDMYAHACDITIVVWRYRDGPESDLVTDGYQYPQLRPRRDCYETDY